MAKNKESYLTSRSELKGAEGGLQVLCVALEVEESAGDRSLQLGGVLPGRRVEGNLVDGSHDCERWGAAEVLVEMSAEGRCSLIKKQMGICCGIGIFA